MFDRIYIVVLSLVVMAASTWYTDTAEALQAVEDGLVSFWTFDEVDIDGDTVKDIVGDNDGTMIGDPKVVAGIINQALELDGSSYVDCGGDESLNLTDALTIEVWIKPNVAGEGGVNAGPLCKAVAGGNWNWQLRYNALVASWGFSLTQAALSGCPFRRNWSRTNGIISWVPSMAATQCAI